MRALLVKLLLVPGLAIAMGVCAQVKPSPSNPQVDYLERSQDVLRRAHQEFEDPDGVSEKQRVEAAEKIAKEAQRGAAAKDFIPPAARRLPALGGTEAAVASMDKDRANSYMGRGAFVFVSTSMPERDLIAAFEAAAEYDAVVLFRGVLKGESLNTTFGRIQHILGRLKKQPNVNVDPRPFEEYRISSVPSVVVYNGSEFVRLAGTLSVPHAKKLFSEKRFGDQGSLGLTREIAEPDLMEEIKERIAKVDWEAKKQAAVDRMWQNVKIHDLPHATASRTSFFDPSVVIDSEIRTPDGQLLAPAGARMNPLDIVNFNKTVIAFDATSKDHLTFAKSVADQEHAKGKGVVLVTTAIDMARPWESLEDYSKALFPHRVFFLDELMAKRFGIAATPTVVRAEGRQFRIEQVAVKAVAAQ